MIYGDGKQNRDFIYVEDVVDATLLALQSESAIGEILNVCTGKSISISELAQVLLEVTERNSQVIHDKPKKGDIHSNYGDPKKAEAILGFKAKTSLREGLKRIISDIS